MDKLIPTLQLLGQLENPVNITILDECILLRKAVNSIEDYEAAQDALRDSDITYIWHENKIIINPELL